MSANSIDHACKSIPYAQIARELATKAHKGQSYGNALPYVAHLENVAQLVLDWREEIGEYWPHSFAAAWLHDLVEDVPGGLALMTQALSGDSNGHAVMQIVHALTKIPRQPLADYFAHIRRVGRYAVAVKIADRVSNIRASLSGPCASPSMFAKYVHEQHDFATMRVDGDLVDMWTLLDALYKEPSPVRRSPAVAMGHEPTLPDADRN